MINEDAGPGSRSITAFLAAALFSGAYLVVDQYRGAGGFPQFSLQCIKLIAMQHVDATRELLGNFETLRVIGHNDYTLHILRKHLLSNLSDCEAAFDGLTTRHCHR